MANQIIKVGRLLASLTQEDRALAISFGRELGGEKRGGRRAKLKAAGVTVKKVRKKKEAKSDEAAA